MVMYYLLQNTKTFLLWLFFISHCHSIEKGSRKAIRSLERKNINELKSLLHKYNMVWHFTEDEKKGEGEDGLNQKPINEIKLNNYFRIKKGEK